MPLLERRDIKRWNGSSWVSVAEGGIRTWNGSSWVDYFNNGTNLPSETPSTRGIYRWTGSAWYAIWADIPDPT